MAQEQTQTDTLYLTYDRGLRRLLSDADVSALLAGDPGETNLGNLELAPGDFGSGTSANIQDIGVGVLRSGKTRFTNTETGFILGLDPSDGYAKFYIGNTTNYLNWTGTVLSLAGSLTISGGTIDIGGADATSFHVDVDGNMWLGAATLGSAVASITNAGVATFTSVVLSGSVAISGIANSTATDISLLEFSHDILFSSTDEDTVSWSSGTITMSNGRTFSISAGNTGNMTGTLRYIIYLDTAISTTVLQKTTTVSSTVGANRIILATAKKATTAGQTATFVATSGIGGLAIDEAQVFIANLAALNADMGSITAGTITLNTSGYIKGGQTAYDTGTGFFLGYSGGAYKFSIGTGGSTTNSLTWDGTNLIVNGYVQSSIGAFGGDGSDGALSISSGTITLDAAGARVLVKNYTSISITGTAKLTISNKHANGTILILKSKGNVILTSSATVIDLAGMGGDGGAAGAYQQGSGVDGKPGTSLALSNVDEGYGGGGGAPPDSSTNGAAGAAGAQYTHYYSITEYKLNNRFIALACGSGGGGGGQGYHEVGGAHGDSGAGGNGGGACLIECRGTYTFTTGTISVSGSNGTSGTDGNGGASHGCIGGAGGGGGGSGMFICIYGTLGTDSGTYTASGGTGGNGGSATHTGASGTVRAGAGGGGGSSLGGAGGSGGAGVVSNGPGLSGAAGSAGSGGGGGSGAAKVNDGTETGSSGGAGGASYAATSMVRLQNKFFA